MVSGGGGGGSPALPLCGMQDCWSWPGWMALGPWVHRDPSGAWWGCSDLLCREEHSYGTSQCGLKPGECRVPTEMCCVHRFAGAAVGAETSCVALDAPLHPLCPAGLDKPAVSHPGMLPHVHGAGGEMGCREVLVRLAQNKPFLEASESCRRVRAGEAALWHLGPGRRWGSAR